MGDGPSSSALPAVWFPLDGGIAIHRVPDQLGPGSLADALNLDAHHPRGSIGPRLGSRSLAGYATIAGGQSGHPGAPMGANTWDGNDVVLRLVLDGTARRLWALVRNAPNKGLMFKADLTADSPGFDVVGAEFDIDDDHVPSVAVYDNKLFIATGTAGLSQNVVVTENDVSVQTLVPPSPPTPVVVTSLAGSRGAATGYIYAVVTRDSKTGATSKKTQSMSSGAFAAKTLQLQVTGVDPAATWDKIEIYRTTDGGDVLRYLTEIANPGSGATTTYTDTTSDDRLSFKTPPERTGRTPTSRYVMAFLDRLLWAYRSETVVQGSLIYYSEAYHPFAVDPAFNFLTVRPEDGDVLTGLARLYNRGFAFKSRQIYELVSGGSYAVFVVQPVVNEGGIGCVAANTLVEIEGRAFFLSYGGLAMFDGEQASIVPGPLSDTAPDQQVYREQIGRYQKNWVTTNFRHDDVATETHHFTLKFFSSPPADPATDTPAQSYSTSVAPARWRVDGRPFPSGGLSMAPGRQVMLQFDASNQFPIGRRYYLYLVANDGHQDLPPADLGQYIANEFRARGLGVNWGRIARAHAIDYWPKRELWLFVPSETSDWPDIKWVLEYDTLQREGGPVWRRELGLFTSSLLATGVNVDADHQELIAPLYGDFNGVVWIDRWPTGIDRYIPRAADLTDAQRVLRARLNETGGDWTLDAMTVLWTAFDLVGEVVTVRDEHGQVYTGLVRGNSTSKIYVSHWLEGRVPPLDVDVDVGLGGMDVRAEFHPQMLDEAAGIVETRELLVEGLGEAGELEVEVRIANQPELLSPQALTRMPQRRRRTVKAGDGAIRRYPSRGRGRYAGLAAQSWKPDQPWRLSKLGLGVHRDGATH